MLLHPKNETFEHLDPRSREIMLKTVAFFESKGDNDGTSYSPSVKRKIKKFLFYIISMR